MSLYASLWGGLWQPAYERLRGRLTPRLEIELERSQWLERERLASRQWRELGALLEHARREVPFYADWFADSGVEVADLVAARNLSPLPVVERAQLMAEPERHRATHAQAGTFAKATGGSTGQPLRFLVDPASDQWRLAMSRRGYAWAGCRPGLRQVYLWGSDFLPAQRTALLKRRLHRALMRQVYVDSFHLGPDELDQALATISRFRPACVVAFTSAALIVARWALAKGWRPPAGLSSVITGAEALFPADRELLERVFGCPVFETYGSREFMLMAAECPAHQGLHVSMENLYIELLKDGKPARPGEVGEVVVTDLHNGAQPFIRYRNGDLAVWAEGQCACGRGLPRLGRVEGRVLDLLRTPDGRELTGTIFPHLLKDFPAVQSYQAEQDRLDHLILRLVLTAPLGQEDQAAIKAAVGGALPGVDIELQPVESIPLTPAGKRRVTIGLGRGETG